MLDRLPVEIAIQVAGNLRIAPDLISDRLQRGYKVLQDYKSLLAMSSVHSSTTAIAQQELFKQIVLVGQKSMDNFVRTMKGDKRFREYARNTKVLLVGRHSWSRSEPLMVSKSFDPFWLPEVTQLYLPEFTPKAAFFASFKKLEFASHATFDFLNNLNLVLPSIRTLQYTLDWNKKLPPAKKLFALYPGLRNIDLSFDTPHPRSPFLSATVVTSSSPRLSFLGIDLYSLSAALPLIQSTKIDLLEVSYKGPADFIEPESFVELTQLIKTVKVNRFNKLRINWTYDDYKDEKNLKWKERFRANEFVVSTVVACQAKGIEVVVFSGDGEEYGSLLGMTFEGEESEMMRSLLREVGGWYH